MRPEEDALDRHRAAIRARLRSTGASLSDPGTVTWKVNREIIVVGGWARAILLQLAHPLIAAGIADHSSFRGSLLASFTRLSSTVRAMLSLTFGSEEDAINAAARINSIHDRVSGHLREKGGAVDAGERYSAHDPELLRWVHATLLDSIPLTYELFVGPLTREERDRYCAEGTVMEPLLDIPEGLLPRDETQLQAYMREVLESRRIFVGDASRLLARAILFPPHWRMLWPLFRPLQLLTIGLLPAAIRDGYGFSWTPRDARALARWAFVIRMLHRAAPAFLLEWPAARRRAPRQPAAASARAALNPGTTHD